MLQSWRACPSLYQYAKWLTVRELHSFDLETSWTKIIHTNPHLLAFVLVLFYNLHVIFPPSY